MEEKITERYMYEIIIEGVKTGEWKCSIESIEEFCQKKIKQLDKKAIKAKELAAKKRTESDELMEEVYSVMSDSEYEPIAVITDRIENKDVSISKVTYRLSQLFKEGRVDKQEIVVSGVDGQKNRKIQGYKRSM